MSDRFIIPSSPTDRKAVLDAIREADASLTRIDAEKEHIKEIVDMLKEKFELPPKQMRKVINAYHKQNLVDVTTAAEEVEELYESFIGSPNN